MLGPLFFRFLCLRDRGVRSDILFFLFRAFKYDTAPFLDAILHVLTPIIIILPEIQTRDHPLLGGNPRALTLQSLPTLISRWLLP
jgi:hypothetical protein